MTGPQNQAPVPPATNPVTYEELTLEHQQKYDEVKAQFEADLIGSLKPMQESSRGADHGSDLYLHVLCMQANRCKHVRTFLIEYRSGGTPCVFRSRGVCWNCRPLTREQCLPAPRRPPGSSCCLSLLAGGF